MESVVQDRLAELKAKAKPFPLKTFLTIYSKAEHECYIGHMQGAKLLYDWLTDDGKLLLDFQPAIYPEINNSSFRVPQLFNSYELDRLTVMLTPNGYQGNYHKSHRAIFITTVKNL